MSKHNDMIIMTTYNWWWWSWLWWPSSWYDHWRLTMPVLKWKSRPQEERVLFTIAVIAGLIIIMIFMIIIMIFMIIVMFFVMIWWFLQWRWLWWWANLSNDNLRISILWVKRREGWPSRALQRVGIFGSWKCSSHLFSATEKVAPVASR